MDDTPVTSFPAPRRLSQLNEQHVTPFTHLVYAATWFSLAVAGGFMTYNMFRKKKFSKRKVFTSANSTSVNPTIKGD